MIMKSSITHVFFDLDHTLWDFDRNSALAFARVFKKHAIQVPVEDFISVYEPINFEYWKRFREERVSKQNLRRGRLIDTFSRFNQNYPLDTIDTLAVAYIDELPEDNHLLDGAAEILEYLAPNYNLHIITNGFQEVQKLKLQKSAIGHFFDTITSSEEVGVKKPNPLVFKAALKKASAGSSESIMIGDTFEADILGAEGIGMKTLFYNYRKEEIPSKYLLVNHLLEIKNHL